MNATFARYGKQAKKNSLITKAKLSSFFVVHSEEVVNIRDKSQHDSMFCPKNNPKVIYAKSEKLSLTLPLLVIYQDQPSSESNSMITESNEIN